LSAISTEAAKQDNPPNPPTEPKETSSVRSVLGGTVQALAVPLLAIFTALVIGGLIIWATTGDLAKVIGPEGAFVGLLQGAIGTPQNIADTLSTATPYIFAGLAVALAFKCGLFNIGAEGQLAVGALCTAFVGYQLPGFPFPFHLLLALVAGLIGGLLWGAIPGVLKAYTGAHEVIVTIMLNYIALAIVQYLLGGPLKDHSPGNVSARTPQIQPEAFMPNIFASTPWEIHAGVLLALVTAFLVNFFLKRTTWGFEIRTVGANQHAARYAGISVPRNIVLAMSLSGMLAGAAGAVEVLGVTHRHELGFGSGYGFDAIAIALLGRTNPFGVVAAAILFGGLKSGATQMQFNTQISASIISVVQALVLLFVSADVIIRWLYRLRVRSERGTLTLSPAAAAAVAAAGQVETLAREYVSPLDVDLTAGYRTMGPAGEEIESAESTQVEEEAEDSG
jgi:simple sugar transport system permease protein